MDMERVLRSSSLAAALLFLTLVVLAAATASGGGDDAAAAAAAAAAEKQCHPRADEPYMLVAFHNRAGEEIRLLADQRPEQQVSGISAFANRSGHWFYAGNEDKGASKRRRRLVVPLTQPQPPNNNSSSRSSRSSRGGGSGSGSRRRRTAESLWSSLGVLVNTDDNVGYYVLVGLQTSGGDKIRLLVVADQRYFYVAGYARGFFRQPNWFFRDGERHQLLLPETLGGGNGSSSGSDSSAAGGGSSSSSSHAEAVASNVLAALMKDGEACCG